MIIKKIRFELEPNPDSLSRPVTLERGPDKVWTAFDDGLKTTRGFFPSEIEFISKLQQLINSDAHLITRDK